MIHAESAHSESMKFSDMVKEILRILRNCSIHLAWSETAKHVTYFVRRLQFSGYSQDFRYRVVKKALRKYDVKKGLCEQRGESMFAGVRDVQERRKNKSTRQEWYKGGEKYESVMFVQPTKGARLQKEVQRIAKKHKIKMRVIERGGRSVKGMLQRSNPFGKKMCGRDRCVLCQNGSDVDCRERGCVYTMMCKACRRKYRGQTGRSMNERINEQFGNWERGEENNPLMRHSELYHDGERFDVEVKVEAKCGGKPSKRLITEAVMIDELGGDETMNGKNEWSYVKLRKVQVL